MRICSNRAPGAGKYAGAGRRALAAMATVALVAALATAADVVVTSSTGSSAMASAGLFTSAQTPGVPKPPTAVYTEDFQNRPTPPPAPAILLPGYTGVTGQTYTANARWLTLCNGLIASYNQSTADATGVTGCGSSGLWNSVQQMADALGLFRGETAAVAQNNYAVTEYTAGDPGAGFIEFQTVTNVALTAPNRFLDFGVDVAADNCAAYAHPFLQFSLLNQVGAATPVGGVIDGCSSTGSVTVPALGGAPSRAVKVGTYTSGGSILFSGTSVGVRMVNNQASGNGNDHAFDNIQILDVSPQLDTSLSPIAVGVGQSSTLTLTVTNTSELDSKNGWSFTDHLPTGLVTAGTTTTTCPGAVLSAPVGGSSVAITANLTTGMGSCTITVPVVSVTTGVYTIVASDFTGVVGMDLPVPATVTYTNVPNLTIVKSSTTTSFNAVGQSIPYSMLVTNTGNVAMTGLVVNDPQLTGVTCLAVSLAPAAATTCTGTRVVTLADLNAGSIVNIATVDGDPPLGLAFTAVSSNQLTIPGIPGTPGMPSVVTGDGQATVTVTPPVSGGTPTSYTVTAVNNSHPGSGGQTCIVTGAAGACTVLGLTNGDSYTFTTTAINAGGTSNASRPSGPVTPPVLGRYLPLSPRRLLDTRGNGARAAAGSTSKLHVTGNDGVPADANAVELNVTVTGSDSAGYVTVYPCTTSVPDTSNLNWMTGDTIAGRVVASLDANGDVCMFTSAATHLVIDVSGAYSPTLGTAALVTLTPQRLLDTRDSGTEPAAGSITQLSVVGANGVPADATAVTLNVTATDAGQSGFITVYPCGTSVPNTSNVNYATGQTIANTVVVTIGTDGTICVYTSAVTHLVIDANGAYSPTIGTASLIALHPQRLLDTRTDRTKTEAGSITRLHVAGVDGTPTGATAVTLNVTAADADTAGFITVYRCGTTVPNTSNLNFVTGHTIANTVVVAIGAQGDICLYTSATAHLVIDLNNAYAPMN